MTSERIEDHAAPAGTVHPCRNCGAALTGRFCANCGQAADVHVPTTVEIVHEVLEGITHSDSRLWRTLQALWFKPGKLTQEFIAGRRAAYLPPFRLYLVMSVAFFLAASFSHTHAGVAVIQGGKIQIATSPAKCSDIQFKLVGSPVWQERIRHGCEATMRDGGASLLHVVIGAMPKAMFVFLPLIALLHMLLYWRPRYRYAVHLLFFIHVHAFFFSVAALVALLGNGADAWPAVEGAADIASSILLWSLPVYAIVALKRVFNGGWWRTLFRSLALFVIYAAISAITVEGVFMYAMLQL